ncbi:hypothetical protein MHYP_G00112970 [Metynnis hypsauchen]
MSCCTSRTQISRPLLPFKAAAAAAQSVSCIRQTQASTPSLTVCWSAKPGKRATFSSRVLNILPTYCPL